jgi:hypothetical protein
MKKTIFSICTCCVVFVLSAAFLLAPAGLNRGELRQLLAALPRHNSFQYINYRSLPETWFTEANRSLEDRHIYIALSNTKTAASKIIARFTGDPYNHVSLAFDESLSTLLSYNGGNETQNPGLNPENPAALRENAGSLLTVYRLPVSAAQKRRIIERIAGINAQGSSYNLLGLVSKRSAKPNIMFCSQFVYAMLDEAGLRLFARDSGKVKPMDFVKLDAGRHLALVPETESEKTQKNFQKILDSRSNLSYDLIR